MVYVTHVHMTETEREEVRRQNQLQDELKRLGEMQALIVLKLGIALRSGLTTKLRDEIEDAAASYGKAFSKLMAACSEPVKYLGRR